MPRRVIRIYLASSPDLKEEKQLFLEALQELNDTKAAARNVVFQLVNPDSYDLNADIREDARIANSDLFVLMLWKTWGEGLLAIDRPAAPIEGKIRFAQSAFIHNGRPRLLIYFRSVLPYMMADPGVQLQQIINLRNAIEASGTHQFTIYDHPLQWRDVFLFHLSLWLDNPQTDTGYFPAYKFPRKTKNSLLRFIDELGADASPSRRRAFEYAIQAFEAIEEGRLTRAEEYFSHALDLDDGPELLHSFGVYLQRIGSLDRAEKIFQRLLTKSLAEEDVNPIYQSLALSNLGLVYARRAANEPLIVGAGSKGRLVADYLIGGPGWRYVNLKHSFERLPYATWPKTLEHGLVAAFRSKDTEPFGQMVSHLYHHSPMPPRIAVLQTLVSNVGGPSAVSKFAPDGSYLANLGRLSSSQVISEREASEVAPEGVQVLATHAEQKNPLIVDKISRIYSGYPEIVKNLGPKPLSIALSSMAEREAPNPSKLRTVNYFLVNPKESRRAMKTEAAAYVDIGGTESAVEEPPISLVANSWFEDENGNALPLRTSFIAGHSYKYFFAIEKVKRLLLLGASDLFQEPYELTSAGNTKVQIEVICPLLMTKNSHKVSRRTVRYYSGTGIRPQSFPLHARTPGDYSLTIRVFYIRRLLYRAVVPISVAAEELHSRLATNDRQSRSNEMARGDHV